MSNRFSRRGISKFYLVPTISNINSPTHTEVAAGVNLTPQIAEVTGFTFSAEPIDTPDMEHTFTPKISGSDNVENSTLTMYQLDGTDAIEDALAKGTVGYIVIFSKGLAGASPAAGDECDVWPIEIGSNAKQYTAANEAAKYAVTFLPTAVPAENVTLT